ncbi:MAG: putative ABC transporter, ATP-binding protein [Parcubacteria group bacterium GW2011_GWA2_47_10b]|nr:MAG: putative ABC transporter, ATP-binding protein [Parcubacteria group bacterium GW2011_GWA2_47_10b]
MIETKNLVKTFKDGEAETKVLKGIDFKTENGEFVAIMGRSGAGKSTFLYLMSLLDEPTSGEIIIDSKDAHKMTAEEKTLFRLEKCGYVFQDYALLPDLTALENVALPLRVRGTAESSHANEKATMLLERVGLDHRLHHYPSELSGGEQQRVAIARSLINKPRILLADEPCANLDTASSETVLKLLHDLNKTLNQTIIMISHEPEDRKWVKRIVWLKDGVIDHIEDVH